MYSFVKCSFETRSNSIEKDVFVKDNGCLGIKSVLVIYIRHFRILHDITSHSRKTSGSSYIRCAGTVRFVLSTVRWAIKKSDACVIREKKRVYSCRCIEFDVRCTRVLQRYYCARIKLRSRVKKRTCLERGKIGTSHCFELYLYKHKFKNATVPKCSSHL